MVRLAIKQTLLTSRSSPPCKTMTQLQTAKMSGDMFDALINRDLSEISRLLESGFEADTCLSGLMTPIAWFCDEVDMPDVIALFISHGANVHQIDSKHGNLLARAMSCGNFKNAMALLDGGANPNQSNKSGDLPAYLAIKSLNKDAVQLIHKMFEKGLDLSLFEKKYGINALAFSLKTERTDNLLALLQNAYRDISEEMMQHFDVAISIAKRNEMSEAVNLLTAWREADQAKKSISRILHQNAHSGHL